MHRAGPAGPRVGPRHGLAGDEVHRARPGAVAVPRERPPVARGQPVAAERVELRGGQVEQDDPGARQLAAGRAPTARSAASPRGPAGRRPPRRRCAGSRPRPPASPPRAPSVLSSSPAATGPSRSSGWAAWAALPASSAPAAGPSKPRASPGARCSSRVPNRARASRSAGEVGTARSDEVSMRRPRRRRRPPAAPSAGGSGRRRPRARSSRSAAVSATERCSSANRPPSMAWASGTSGCSSRTPCAARSNPRAVRPAAGGEERRGGRERVRGRADVVDHAGQGELRAAGPAAEGVRPLERARRRGPAAASVHAAASPLGPDPTTTASRSTASVHPGHPGAARPGGQDGRMPRAAAVDCGTNSVRLLVTDLDPVAGTQTDLDRQMRVVRLGEGVDATGRLSEAALARTFAAVEDYARTIADLGAERVRFVATSASRDAENAADFVAGIRDRLGRRARGRGGRRGGRAVVPRRHPRAGRGGARPVLRRRHRRRLHRGRRRRRGRRGARPSRRPARSTSAASG